jgi:hypothetical protein
VFTPISAILGLLFFASTLPNGIRLVEIPSERESVEIVAGYTSGELAGFTSTAGAVALLFDAYASGARIEFIDERDRTALRITAPKWSLPVLTERLPALFTDIPEGDVGAAPSSPSAPDFRAKVEEEIRNALLGPDPHAGGYTTENAFVLISAPPPASLRDALSAIPKRARGGDAAETVQRLPAERTLRFKSDLAEGAVIFASPIPGVYYKQWYLVLLLDRLIQRIVPLRLKTEFPLNVRSFYYRLELSVPSGQFPEPDEEKLLQELQRLQFVPASPKDLAAARQDALAYLDSRPVREWFASHDLLSRHEEGVQWIQAMSADDMRIAARDLLIMNRVVATWAPKPRQTSVATEQLAPATGDVGAAPTSPIATFKPVESRATARPPVAFPAHTHSSPAATPPERLTSGVSIAPGAFNAVFVSGRALTRFDRAFADTDLIPFQQYRADRVLVFAPPDSLNRARQLWSQFSGNANGETAVSRGKVSAGDLAALYILKTILDIKLIESGWWRDASLDIDANAGSELQIRAAVEKRTQILEWIKAVAETAMPDAYFAWAKEVALHRLELVRDDLQALLWERDTLGSIQDLETVSLKHVQDVARIYF